ncbi:hypothetical protein [Serratia quinivorans]|uniref:hypothetical protein n=1 Tax=Serratia quinivorans TaxID=137545 RepID=UPI0034C5C310
MNRDFNLRNVFKGFAKKELLSCPACGGGLEYANSVERGFYEWDECERCDIHFHREEVLEITLNDVLLEAYLDAKQRIAELEQKESQGERQSVIDGLAGAGEAWSDIEEYMVKWDGERRNG